MTKQSRPEFDATWDGQLGCADQYDPIVREAVWRAMLESDPMGASWGTGVRRAPRVTAWGWAQQDVARAMTPTLLFSGDTDGQVDPGRVVELYEDLGSEAKLLVHVACSSHYAMWENNRGRLFAASLEWLESRTVQGMSVGEVRLSK